MIVRISTEGQYRVPDEETDRLNQLDNDAVAAVEAGDEARFHEVFEQMLALVRSEGRPVGPDVLEPSQLIMPPPDLTFAEAGDHFTGEGLIPDEGTSG